MKKIIFIAVAFISMFFTNIVKAVDFYVAGKCEGVNYTNVDDHIKATIICTGTTGICVKIASENGVVHVTFYCDEGPIDLIGSGPGVFDGTSMDEIGDGVVFPS